MMAVEHIPAWRRLGLKLKSEEEPHAHHASVLPTIEAQRGAKKRKLALPHGIGEQIRAGAREIEPMNGTAAHAGQLHRTTLPHSPSSSSPDQMHTPQTSPRKRKSVSFTPDTKVEDGGKNLKPLNSPRLDAPPNLFDVYMSEATGAADDILGQDIVTEDMTKEKKTKSKDKKEKKDKKQKPPSDSNEELSPSSQPIEVNPTPTPTEEVSPQLQYLNEYHHSRSTWKFNKNKQNWLIKNAFDLNKIPSAYDAALEQYIRGIESKMARLRLFERAQEVVAADDAALAKENSGENGSGGSAVTPRKRARSPSPHDPQNDIYTDEARIADQAAALKRIRAQVRRGELQREEEELRHSKDFQRRLFNRRRAELLLWATEPSEAYFASGPHPQIPITVPRTRTVFTTETAAPATASATDAATNGDETGPKRRRRRRKRRTGIADDDSSSSDSGQSEDDDADGDSTEQRALRHARAIVTKQPLQLGPPLQLTKPGKKKEKRGADSDASSTSQSGSSESESGDETSSSGEDDSEEDESGSESESGSDSGSGSD